MLSILRLRMKTNDEGFAMVLVLGIVGIVTTLMVVATLTGVRSLESSRQHVNFEGALSTAESAIDAALARTQTAYDNTGADSYAIPSSTDPTCAQPSITWPFSVIPAPLDERNWARSKMLAMAADHPLSNSTRNGDFVFFKPRDHQVVYGMSWSPRYGGAEVKSRLLKAEYLFTPYTPNAILTSGNLEIGSSTTVTSAPPADPALAAVHTNGNLTVTNGNPTVYGKVSQAGTGALASSNKFPRTPRAT